MPEPGADYLWAVGSSQFRNRVLAEFPTHRGNPTYAVFDEPEVSPEVVLSAVERMTPEQLRRLAGLLGIEQPHPTLSLPSKRGGFIGPEGQFVELELVTARGVPPGWALARYLGGEVLIDVREAQESAPGRQSQ